MIRFDAIYAGYRLQSAADRRAALTRLEWLANFMDTALVIPGTGVRFGADAIIGLWPVIGDAIGSGISALIVAEAYRLGAPGHLIARMVVNIAIDGFVGSIPVLGDAFDVLWRANRRNVALLREHLEDAGAV
jgi:uncharacterized protein DUF4112